MTMRAVFAANGSCSQQEQGAQLCAESFGRRLFDAAMRAVQGFCDRENLKASYELKLASGHSLRACQAWLSGDRDGGGVLASVLLTDMGPDVLRGIRAEAEAAGKAIPVWLDDLEMAGEVAKALRRQRKNKAQRALLREKTTKT